MWKSLLAVALFGSASAVAQVDGGSSAPAPSAGTETDDVRREVGDNSLDERAGVARRELECLLPGVEARQP